jgi:glycosyltransferase involved in cell wall biosynthesis
VLSETKSSEDGADPVDLRVAVITPYPPQRDGIGVHAAALIEAMPEWVRIDVLDVNTDAVRPAIDGSTPGRATVHRVPKNRVRALREPWRRLRILRPEVIHIHFAVSIVGLGYLSSLGAALWSRVRFGSVIVITNHEVTRELGLLGPVGRILHSLLVRAADCTTVYTDAAMDVLVTRCGATPDKILRAVHGTTLGGPDADADLDTDRPAGSDDLPLIFTFGFVHPDKGTDVLLEAVALMVADDLCPDFRVRIAGEVRPRRGLFRLFGRSDLAYQRKVAARARDGLQDCVDLTSYLDDASLADTLRRCTLFVAPYLSSTQSGALNRAMGAGVAVVASDLPGLRSDLGEAPRWVAANDAPKLAAALTHLLVHPEEVDELRAASLQRRSESSMRETADHQARAWSRLVRERTATRVASPERHPSRPAATPAPGDPNGVTPPANVLAGRGVAVDVRYLKRRGIGISEAIVVVLADLTRAGARVILLTDDPEHAEQLQAEWPHASCEVLASKSGFVWEQRDLPRYLRRAAPDVYLSPANWGIPLARTPRTIRVLLVHDLVPLQMPSTYIFPRPAWATKYLLSTFISIYRADVIVTVSEATAGSVRRYRPGADVHARYISLPDAQPASEDPQSSPRHRVPYLLYNGGFDPRKNVGKLLLAFAHLKGGRASDLKLVVLGEGPGWLTPMIDRLGIGGDVERPGFVDDQEKSRYVREAAAIVYPSSLEGFGLPVAEGLAAGVPVVTGTGGSLQEVGGAVAVRVDVSDPVSIASGIERALSLSRETLAEQGPQHLQALRQRLGRPLSNLLAEELSKVVSPCGGG